MYIKYKLFVESILRDVSILKSDMTDNLSYIIKDNINKKIKDYYNFEPMIRLFNDQKIKIYWNHKNRHDLIKRLKNRTMFNDIDDFINITFKSIKYMLKYHIKDIKKIKKKKPLNLSLKMPYKYRNIYFICRLEKGSLDKNVIEIYFVTIINSIDNKIDRNFDIPEKILFINYDEI